MKLPLPAIIILLTVASTRAAEPASSLGTDGSQQPAQKSVEKPADPPSTPKRTPQNITPALKAAADLAQAGRLMDAEHLAAALKAPTREKLALSPPSQTRLSGREIAERARAGFVRVGWYYHCSGCGNWHINAAGGYAIAADAVATARHVLEPPAKMRNAEGFPIAIRGESDVLPVLAIVVADKDADAAVVRLGASNLTPLPLADDVRVGDAVYCLSDPHGVRDYFSSGIVNRFFSTNPALGKDPRFQRLNVSTDWAPGSSGAAILDEHGSVVGHVARISSIFNDQQAPEAADHAGAKPATLMNLHEAVPAKSVLGLLAK